MVYTERIGKMKTVMCEDNCIVLKGDRLNVVATCVKPPGAESSGDFVEKLSRCLFLLPCLGYTLVAGDFNTRLNRPDDPRTPSVQTYLGRI